ncbi:OB-fold nucleic acid binding domain protein [Synechococcus sp. PCC 7335]|uniref:hypothetical protein n=1 Tax=Synechococcus sp. (strain ATCC 29403 / PCC 7335) TaxID=91464 RepID=UPI00017EB42B|nr:hypothetical protein [Synechococcus sp. PCC 7335]EDX84698.1 OB-fold nucleic acid binding domain protein [Synechococcus sp. PCC 7335]
MKVFATSNQLIKLPGLALGLRGLVLLALLLGSCAVAETGPGVPSGSEVPLPSMRLPGLRLPDQPIAIDSLSAERAEDNVSISGRVTQRVATLDGWIYQIKDDTGSLWVLTRQSDPNVGEIATVSGIVKHEAIVIEAVDASEVYLEEHAYRAADSAADGTAEPSPARREVN